MKIKRHLKFSILLLCLLGIYVLLITHIDLLIIDYDGYTASLPNRYSAEYLKTDTIGNLLDYSEIEVATNDDIGAISRNDYLLTMLSYLHGTDKQTMNKTLIEYGKNKMVNLLKNNSYPHVIFYINFGEFDGNILENNAYYNDTTSVTAFTVDVKDFYYRNHDMRQITGECRNNNATDETNIDDEIAEVISNVRRHLNFMGLLAKYDFEFSSIRNAWLNEYGIIDGDSQYYIEDYKNSIKIEYNYLCDSIDSIQIGFNK